MSKSERSSFTPDVCLVIFSVSIKQSLLSSVLSVVVTSFQKWDGVIRVDSER